MLLSGFSERMFDATKLFCLLCGCTCMLLVGAFSHAVHLCIGSKVVIFYPHNYEEGSRELIW